MGRTTFSARTREDLEEMFAEHGGPRVLADLVTDGDPTELTSPASRWSRRHLLVYRLLVYPEKAFLETFAADHAQACPVCKVDRPGSQTIDSAEIDEMLRPIGPLDLLATHRDLLHRRGGPFWASLARACDPNDPAAELGTRTHIKRARRPPSRTNFVDSNTAIQGSSSPICPSSSECEVEAEEVDEDGNENRRRIPEHVAVRLATDFASYVLHHCLVQKDEGIEVRSRIEPKQASASIAGFDGITCEDDGGIDRYRRWAYGWVKANHSLAVLEGKRAFRQLRVDPRTGKSSPIVSDDTLAQYLGEAVINWRSYQSSLNPDVFLITVCGTFLRFIHFRFGTHYGHYLDASKAQDQIRLINDREKDTCAHMRGTQWFNLELSEGRKLALCHILALLRWHDAHSALRAEARDSDAGQDDEQTTDSESDSDGNNSRYGNDD